MLANLTKGFLKTPQIITKRNIRKNWFLGGNSTPAMANIPLLFAIIRLHQRFF